MLTALLPACSSASKSDVAPAPLPDRAAGDTFDLSPDRLGKLMPYVFEQMHWGYSALKLYPADAEPRQHDRLTVKALTPDGRRVDIRAEKVDADKTRVAVFVQYFGDDKLQRELLNTIAQQQQRFAGKEIR